MKANGEFKIENGIPLPAANGRSGELTEALRKLKIGESFLMPIKLRVYAGSCAKNIGIKITSRKTDNDHARIWRTE